MSLNDRNYMRGATSRGGSAMSGPGMMWLLIGINVAVYLLAPAGSPLHEKLMLTSWDFHFYSIVTAMFTHANFSHILLNMFGLYIFGSLIAERLGAMRFALLYFIGGAVGNVLFMMFFPGEMYSLLGASGACYAVMMATAMIEPDRSFVLIFLPFFPIKTKTLVIAYTVIELVSQLSGGGRGDVAHLAHLGGFLGGFLYIRFAAKELIRWMPFGRRGPLFPPRGGNPGQNTWRTPDFGAPPPGPGFRAAGPVTQRELDYLLDKISRSGINSLTEAELARLKQAREEMQK